MRLGEKKDEIQIMNSFKIKFFSLSGCILLCLLASQPSAAEIVPDTTLTNNSIVTPNCTHCKIEGGTTVGNNLFHSFEKFSIPTGGSAEFNNALTIQNIITRVTGNDRSNIDGLISASGTANLFFLNPSGITFGPNASLNIGGSFIASTASSLKFADGTEFRTNAPQTTPLLTISVPMGLQVPSGLQFGSNPGEIVNLSQASPNNAVNSFSLPVGLQVKSGRTLALVGGNVSLNGGNLTAGDNLTAVGGRIELGSVASGGLVNLSQIETGYAFGYAGVKNFGDIQLSQVAVVDASGSSGGAIQLQGRNINLSGNSIILSTTSGTSGSQRGGDLAINASASVNLSGGSQIGTYAQGVGQAGDVKVRALDSVELAGKAPDDSLSFLGSQVCPFSSCQSVTGNGGNLTIETGKLLVRDGAIIDSSTFGAGKAGNVQVKANNIELMGFATTLKGPKPSGIFAQVADTPIDNAGDAGTLRIETKQLTVLGGAQISTAARKTGQGGDLTINASDSILLSGFSPLATADLLDSHRSGIFVSAQLGATGNVGNLNVKTGLLTVENGAFLSAANLGTGQGGTANLNVRQLVIRDGGNVNAGSFDQGPGSTLTVNAAESVEVTGTTIINNNRVISTLSTSTGSEASGKAGDLRIMTNRLNVRDGAEVTVSSMGSGDAGNLDVTANSIRLNNGATLNADTKAGQGNIILRSGDLILNRDSKITTNATGSNVNGGNININTDVLAAVENSKISADSTDAGGGRVFINTQGLFRSPDSTITATGATPQLNGTVQINTPDIDPSRGLVTLPTITEVTPKLVSSSCAAASDNSFTITGRGGLPPSPSEPLTNDVVWTDARLQAVQQHNSNKPKAKPHTKPKAELIAIVPATGWVFNKEKGEVTLISSASSATGLGSNPATCSTR